MGNEREGFVNWAINTPRGRTLEAFLFYALRCIRIGEKKGSDEKEAEWKKLEPVLNYELKEALNGKYEFSTLAGRWLPNLYYMNKEWVEHNFAQIFPNQNPNLESNWRAALDGYSHIGTVYSVLYNLLKKNGDLDKVLDGIEHKQIRERIIDNIAISYLRGQESLDHRSLFAKILHGWKTEDISDVIGLFWQHRDVKFEKEEERISFCEKAMGFWRHCFNKIKGNEETYPEILSDLNQLTVFLDKIDAESKTWLLQSTPYVEKRYHASFFLEYLDALADVSPKEVGEIFVAMLESTIPIFKEENISSIVQKLYSHKQKELANQICDKYGRAGHEFLRPIYEKYN
ncbi:MAG: hypothetical protein A3E74_03315 [Omnitrophica bacterium RIFCSPHIGHO2_12_FULL_44_12]|nr:MAG: hypothetical protein A3E74_03315 [Omnitrophica bacterium RIFCSPHIGHO2_12_FULL_44_12]